MKRKYIYISKQNSEIISGSVNIQNDLFYDTFLFQLVHEVSPTCLASRHMSFQNIQRFLKYEYNIGTKSGLGRPEPRKKMKFWNVREAI